MLIRVGEQARAVLDVLGRHGRQLRVELALGLELGTQGRMPRLEVGDDGRDLAAGERLAVLRSSRSQDRVGQVESEKRARTHLLDVEQALLHGADDLTIVGRAARRELELRRQEVVQLDLPELSLCA